MVVLALVYNSRSLFVVFAQDKIYAQRLVILFEKLCLYNNVARHARLRRYLNKELSELQLFLSLCSFLVKHLVKFE
jgi:hypothetical protein